MQPADPARRENDRLGRHDDLPMIVEILEDRAGAVTLIVAEQFDRGAELEQLDLLIQHFVLEHPHDLKAGIVGAGQEARLGTAAALLHMEIAVGLPIEQHTQFDQPLRNRGTFFDHHLEQVDGRSACGRP